MLEVVHQADGREHERIACKVSYVGMTLETRDDGFALGGSFSPGFGIRLVAREADRRAPMVRVFPHLWLVKIEQIGFHELAQHPGRVADRARRYQVATLRKLATQRREPRKDELVPQLWFRLVQSVYDQKHTPFRHLAVDPGPRHQVRQFLPGRGFLDQR